MWGGFVGWFPDDSMIDCDISWSPVPCPLRLKHKTQGCPPVHLGSSAHSLRQTNYLKPPTTHHLVLQSSLTVESMIAAIRWRLWKRLMGTQVAQYCSWIICKSPMKTKLLSLLCAKTPSRSGSKERPFCASLKIKRNSSWKISVWDSQGTWETTRTVSSNVAGWEIPISSGVNGKIIYKSINGWLSFATFDYQRVAGSCWIPGKNKG